jgi:hypothetical protein
MPTPSVLLLLLLRLGLFAPLLLELKVSGEQDWTGWPLREGIELNYQYHKCGGR